MGKNAILHIPHTPLIPQFYLLSWNVYIIITHSITLGLLNMFIHFFLNKRITYRKYLHLTKENRWWKWKCGISSRFAMFGDKGIISLVSPAPSAGGSGVDWHGGEEFVSYPAARSLCWQSCFRLCLPQGEKTAWEFCWIWCSFVKTLYDASRIYFFFLLFIILLKYCFGLSYMQESY